ncbi:hypothetical protein BG000_000483 [Podila horticola]|nr:hypothetical protein BG000_000483 [Podila horticola]
MLGSVTKAFTATAVAEMVAEGELDWATPVNTYLPELETTDPILTSQLTLQDLLSHRTVFKYALAGVPLEELVQNKVLKPLGLETSGFTMSESRLAPAQMARLVHDYE